MDTLTSTEVIENVSPSVEDRCNAALTVGFATCPLLRFIYPEPERYLEHFAGFVKAYCGEPYQHGSGAYIPDGVKGTVLWQTPDEHGDHGELVDFLVKTTLPANRDDVRRLFDRFYGFHPNEPYFYVSVIAVDPYFQRQGLGTALFRHALQYPDRAGRVSYLEATTVGSARLYGTLGWKVVDEVQIGNSPVYYPMIREPQGR
jgi:ribosomal protein S18 acetylase RimI-like enzyme